MDMVVADYIVVEQVCESCGVINDHLTQDCETPSVYLALISVISFLAWLNAWVGRWAATA